MALTVLLDMDGVLCDWVKGMCELHASQDPYADPTVKHSYDGIYSIAPSKTAFWSPVTNGFWEALEKTPEADALVELANRTVGVDNVYICSSPPRAQAIEGKQAWLEKHFPQFKRHFVFTPAKHLLANDRTALIDDFEDNVEAFQRAGGAGIMFPQPWNWAYYAHWMGTETKISWVQCQLETFTRLRSPDPLSVVK